MKKRLCMGEQHDISKDVAGTHFTKLSHTVHGLISVVNTFWHHSHCFHDSGMNFAHDAATVACTVLYSVFWNKSKVRNGIKDKRTFRWMEYQQLISKMCSLCHLVWLKERTPLYDIMQCAIFFPVWTNSKFVFRIHSWYLKAFAAHKDMRI